MRQKLRNLITSTQGPPNSGKYGVQSCVDWIAGRTGCKQGHPRKRAIPLGGSLAECQVISRYEGTSFQELIAEQRATVLQVPGRCCPQKPSVQDQAIVESMSVLLTFASLPCASLVFPCKVDAADSGQVCHRVCYDDCCFGVSQFWHGAVN